MEQKKESKPIMRGVFYFDPKHILAFVVALFALIGLAVIIVNQFAPINYAWVIAAVCIGIGTLIAIIGMIVAGKIRKRKFEVYADHIEYNAGKKLSFRLELKEIAILEHRENALFFNNKYLVDRLCNAEEIADKINELLHPIVPKTLPTDVCYVNLAIEELRKAKELLDYGLITQEDYAVLKERFMDTKPNQYLVKSSGTIHHVDR